MEALDENTAAGFPVSVPRFHCAPSPSMKYLMGAAMLPKRVCEPSARPTHCARSRARCPQIAGSLPFTTLLAMVPTFAIAVALLSRTPLFGDMMGQLKVFLLLNLAPEIAGKIITVYMGEFAHNARRLTLLGLGFLFVTAVALMLTIDRSLNTIWRSHRKRPFLVSVFAYVLLLSVGPVLIGLSVSITTYLMSLPERWHNMPATARPILLQAVPTAVSTVAFFLIYRLVPHRKVPWAHALTGGIVAAVLFELGKE